MGFFKNLGKGFVRSAVNQVGRDYGRTISNDVFGDRHAIPHRAVGQPMYVQHGQPIPPPLPNQLPPGGRFSQPNMILWIFGSMLIPIIVAVIAGFKGLFLVLSETVTYEYFVTETMYTQDARYRSGMRPTGTMRVKKKLHLPSYSVDQRVVNLQRRDGWILMAVGVVFFLAWMFIFIKAGK